MVTIIDDGHNIVTERLQLALKASGNRFFVIGDQDSERPIHNSGLLGSSHADGSSGNAVRSSKQRSSTWTPDQTTAIRCQAACSVAILTASRFPCTIRSQDVGI